MNKNSDASTGDLGPMSRNLSSVGPVVVMATLSSCLAPQILNAQPQIESRATPVLRIDELMFKDSNKNGALDIYEDWRLPVERRIADLSDRMTLEEKAGLMVHPNIAVTEDGSIRQAQSDRIAAAPPGAAVQGAGAGQVPLDAPPPSIYIVDRHVRNVLNNGVADPATFADWSNRMQEMAEGTRLGIPIVFSSDPRHGAMLGAHVTGHQYFSQWPSREGQFGLAASRNSDLAYELGRVTAEEYRAVGLHMNLGPQIDLPTEPRWRRNVGTFSEDAELTSEQVVAYIRGAQGDQIGPNSIVAMLKHWPGSGPHRDGEGRQLVYPGNNFDYHLIPFRAAFDAGGMAVMGYYSGTPIDNGLAVNYSRYIMTDLLRGEFGFDGVITSDWGVISRVGPLREDLIDLSIPDRYRMSIDAGVDQFGAESDPAPIIELVRIGALSEERIDQSVSRILRWHFDLGLFEDPYVDTEAAADIVGNEKNQELGYRAQLESIVLLSNDGLLPIRQQNRPNIYVEGMDTESVELYGNVVATPQESELAILRVNASEGFRPGQGSTDVNIELPQDVIARISAVTEIGVPTIVGFNIGSSLVVLPGELIAETGATLMLFDVLDNPVLDVIFGAFNPVGKLPFELPSSMEAVRNQKEDVPYDSSDPLFEFGFGLTY